MNPNIAARLIERAERHPEAAAIVEYEGGRPCRITFRELARRVEALSAGMRYRGIESGDPVLLFVPMSIELYVALLATLHAGATAVFVDAWADPARLDAAVGAVHPKLFVGSPTAHLLRLRSRAIRGIPLHWFAGRRLLTLQRYEREGGRAADVSSESPALITFTTGSTGAPKASCRSHGFLWAQHEVLAGHLGLSSSDVDMPTLPVFVLNNLALGIPSVIPDFDPSRPADIRPERIVRQMRGEGVTTTSGSPAFYEKLCGWAAERGVPLPLRGIWTGGAPVYPTLASRMADAVKGEAHVVYGSTEAEPIAGIEAREMMETMRASGEQDWGGICCGRPVPQIRLKIVTAHDGAIALDGRGWTAWDVSAGEAGEIVVAGDHVVGEYLDAPEENRRNKIREGSEVWHRTGDAGYLDPEGRLWLLGRVASRVVRDGTTWWPVPAEVRALRLPGVTHAAFIGEPDPKRGARSVLCLECDPGTAPQWADIREALGTVPVDRLVVLREIPRDPRHASKTNTTALRRAIRNWRA